MSYEHSEKVAKHEKHHERFLKERQDTFDEAFKEEIKEYKKTGSIPIKGKKNFILTFLKKTRNYLFTKNHNIITSNLNNITEKSSKPEKTLSLEDIVLDTDTADYEEFLGE